jgi:hypothetical protein
MNTIPTKRRLFIVAVSLMAVAGAVVFLHSRRMQDIIPINSSGGSIIDIPASEEGVFYLQGDPRWATDTVGGSKETLSAVGCTICSVAMAAEILGYNVTPKELNAALIEKGGYTGRGWLIWSKVKQATNGKIIVEVPSRLLHSDIEKELLSGSIPVVKFYLSAGIPHWVTIVGKSRGEYLVRDPLNKALKVKVLSDMAEQIVSVRYVTKR